MSRGFNQCSFIGNLGDDPEIRYTQAGVAIASFSVAVNEQWKDKQGNKQERVEWVRCTAFDKLAEIVDEYLKKGAKVFVQGKLQTDIVEGKNGGEDKYYTKVILTTMQMLDSKPEGSGGRDSGRGGDRDRGRDDDRGSRGGSRDSGRGESRDGSDRSSRERAPVREGRDDDQRSSQRGGRNVATPASRHDEPFPDDDIPF